MKASDFITHLQQMIEEHGDLPLALTEINDRGCSGDVYIEIDGIEDVRELGQWDKLIDKDDFRNLLARKVFLID